MTYELDHASTDATVRPSEFGDVINIQVSGGSRGEWPPTSCVEREFALGQGRFVVLGWQNRGNHRSKAVRGRRSKSLYKRKCRVSLKPDHRLSKLTCPSYTVIHGFKVALAVY